MPRIPTYTRQVSLSAENPNAPGSIAAAGALGNTFEQVGDVIQKQSELIRRRDNANKLLIMGASYDDDQRAFDSIEKQKQGQDSYDNMTRGAKFREDSIKKYTQDVNDPELKQAITQHIFARSGSMLNDLSAHQARQREEVTKTALNNMTEGIAKDAYAGADLQESLDRAMVAIKTQQSSGSYGEEGAVNILMGAEKKIAEAHLDGLIQRNPLAALDAIKSGKYNQFLDQKTIEKYDKEMKPKLNAYAASDILSKVDEQIKSDPDGEYDIAAKYEAAKKMNKDPGVLDDVYKELERNKRLHDQAKKDTFDMASGNILLNAHSAWDRNQEVSINAIKSSPDFAKMHPEDQVKLLDKVMAENWRIYSHKQTIAMEGRRLAADERRAERDAREETIRRQTETANYYEAHPEEILQMSKERFTGFAREVSNADYKRFASERQKNLDPRKLTHAVIAADTKTRLLEQAGIKDPEEVKKYSGMVQRYVDNIQRSTPDHQLSPKEIQDAVVQGLQHVAVNEKTSRLGIPTGTETTLKRRMEVKVPGAILNSSTAPKEIPPEVNVQIDALAQKRGIKLTPIRRQMLYNAIVGGK